MHNILNGLLPRLVDRAGLCLLIVFLTGPVRKANAQFTPDRLAVLEYAWNGTLPDPGGPLTIREFAFDGTPGVVMSVPSTGPNAVVNSQNAFNGAQLTLAQTGDKLVFTGFTATGPAGTALETSSASLVPRTIGTVDAAGNFARPFTTNSFFSGTRMRSAVSDGTGYWAAGGNSGICYLGPGPTTVINADQPSIEALHFASGGNLFATNGNTVYRLGTGAPTSPAALTTLLNSSAIFDLQMSPDGTICYTSTSSTIRKWILSGGTWSNVYNFNAPGWLVHIAVDFRGTVPVIYGLHNLPSKLVKYVDNGAPVAETILATGSGSINWYGLSFTPGTTCGVGAACDDGNPTTSNDVIQANCICAGVAQDCMGVAGGSALPGSSCDDLDPNTVADTWSAACICTGQQVHLNVKVLLAGALPATGALMNDQLRSLPSFPLSEPYTALGLPPTGGHTTITSPVLTVLGLNALVDWVLVELRAVAAPGQVVARRAGLLQRDGDVVDLDGISPLVVPAIPGTYHVAVRHRNHLGAMTASGIALSSASVVVDFRPTAAATWGNGAQRNMGSFMALWNGDCLRDGMLGYTGANNDRDPILVAVGGNAPNNTVSGYLQTDVNLNGSVSYTGTNNDRDPLLLNVGSATPNNTRVEQLP